LPAHLAAVLGALLQAADKRLSDGWWRLSTIARLVLGEEHYGEDPRAGQRTAGRWMAELGERGWVQRTHRYRSVAGHCQGTSNLWRFVIPAELRAEVLSGEERARARNQSPHSVSVGRPASVAAAQAAQDGAAGPDGRPGGAQAAPVAPLAENDVALGEGRSPEGFQAALSAARSLLRRGP